MVDLGAEDEFDEKALEDSEEEDEEEEPCLGSEEANLSTSRHSSAHSFSVKCKPNCKFC